ncbi:MAG: 3-deoxy-7-phosphoheptulonate synthase [Negativicutes bacterium]
MIILMNAPTREQLNRLLEKLQQHGLVAQILQQGENTIVSAAGDPHHYHIDLYERMTGVDRVIPILTPFKLVSREFCPQNTKVQVGNVVFGGESVQIIAGPCAVESYEQLYETAVSVKKAGAVILRGGTYKPRTSPYSFQGLEKEGLKILQAVGQSVGLPVVSEVTDPRTVGIVAQYADMLQIGARNMQNFALLKEIATINKPVLLKRGNSATIEEWLMAAEYIAVGGNLQIVLCERGIRTFEPSTRNTLDLNAVPVVKQLCHLPVIVDPSHGTGHWKLVGPMSKAALAAGADGLIIEVHPHPDEALSDGAQSLTPVNFSQLMIELKALADVLGRSMLVGGETDHE